MKPLGDSIDVQFEIRSIASFARETWDGIPEDFELIVTKIQEQAFKDAKNWVVPYSLTPLLRDAIEKRREELIDHHDFPSAEKLLTHDVKFRGIFNLILYSDELYCTKEKEGLDFEREVTIAYRLALRMGSRINEARPRGWEDAIRGYEDFDGMESYDPRVDEDRFKGSNTCGPGVAPLPSKLALPYVLYDHVCQGRRAELVLIASIYGHFLGIKEHINTLELKEAVSALVDKEFPVPMIGGRLHSDHPLVEAALQKGGESTVADYEESLARAREMSEKPTSALTKEEKRSLAKKLIQEVADRERSPQKNRPRG